MYIDYKCNLIDCNGGKLDILYSHPEKCIISKTVTTTIPSPLQLELSLRDSKSSIKIDVPFISELEFDRMYESVYNFSYNHLDGIHSPKISFNNNYLLICIESILYVYNLITFSWKHYLLTSNAVTFTVDKDNIAVILQKDKKLVFIELSTGQIKDKIPYDININVNYIQLFSSSNTEFAVVSIEYKRKQPSLQTGLSVVTTSYIKTSGT